MIRSVKDLEGFAIGATDGTIGKVTDFYFDDESWVIRYVVVDTSAWPGREVLLSPNSMGEPDWGRQVLPVTITKEQVKHSPGVDTDHPLSRQHDPDADPLLRSSNAMTGFHLHANDGEIGHLQGFLVDDRSWAIRFIIVNSTNWWLGHHVLVSPKWIRDVSWSQSSVTVNLDRQAIKTAPAYDSDAGVGRDTEESIYNHYNRNGYWPDKREGAAARRA
jgi:hypothetical protein